MTMDANIPLVAGIESMPIASTHPKMALIAHPIPALIAGGIIQDARAHAALERYMSVLRSGCDAAGQEEET